MRAGRTMGTMQHTSARTPITADIPTAPPAGPRRSGRRRAKVGVVGALIGATVVLVAPQPAGAAVSATTSGGTLTVTLSGDADVRNLELAADLWYSIRRHWCLEGQRRTDAPGAG